MNLTLVFLQSHKSPALVGFFIAVNGVYNLYFSALLLGFEILVLT